MLDCFDLIRKKLGGVEVEGEKRLVPAESVNVFVCVCNVDGIVLEAQLAKLLALEDEVVDGLVRELLAVSVST